MASELGAVLRNIAVFVFELFVMLFALFFFFRDGDAVLDSSCLDGLDRFVANLTVSRLPGVSHWVQEEAPEVVNEIVARFLRKTRKDLFQ